MSEHKATVSWTYSSGDFLQGTYPRSHDWTFDGGVVVPASAAPTSVPPPYSNPLNVDPEEAYVAALASCHMLTFLYLASQSGFVVLSYRDEATGRMTKNERGVLWVSSVELRPEVVYGGGNRPSAQEEADLHHAAHEECYLANSVKTEIRVIQTPR